jgi:prepilin-type N-terminal cleavage/methylation domain-containing protein
MESQRTRGFTIIELMIVVVIVAVLLALAAPSFREQLARRTLEGAANELSADLQYARSQAVSNNAATALATTSTSQYTITSGANTYKTVTLDPVLSVTSGVTVSYDPLRATANTATLTLTSNRTAASLRLETNVMGRVKLCLPPGSDFKGYQPC